jgi:hypothetical protein
MTGQEAVTWLMEKWESFGSPITVNNAAWRALCLAYIQRSGSRMWMGTSTGAAHPEWSWTYNRADITADSTGEITDMPPDYHALSKNGAIYPINGNKQTSRLRWIPPLQMIRQLRLGATGGASASIPCEYSEMLNNINVDGQFPGGKRIFVWRPPSSGTVPLEMVYKTKPPTFADIDDSDPTAMSNLAAIPDEYHETILVDGAIAELMVKAGDGRAPIYEAKFLRGIAEAWAEENQGQNEKRRWGARYGHGRQYGGYSR